MVAFRGIAEGVENSNYSLRTSGGDFILTLYEKRVDPAELPWFLGLMEHLAGHGIACPRPVRGRDGQALRQLAGRHAAITTFLPGVWPRRVRPGIAARWAPRWPACTWPAPDYAPTRPNALGPDGWAPLLDRARGRADEVQPGLASELDAALSRILVDWPAALPVGHIHADLFPDNVFFLEGRVSGLIDFYFAATDILAYDIAVCLNAWCFEADFSLNVTKARALLAAYEAVRPLSAAERRGAAGAVPGRGDALPADPAVRLAQHAAGRVGHPQGSDGISAPVAVSSGRPRTSTPMDSDAPGDASWKSGPMAAASPIPARAAGARSCAFAATSGNCPAPSPRPPTTAWN